MLLSILVSMVLLTLILEYTSTLSASSENETTLDLTNFQAGIPVEHTHIWETKYDNFNHWQQCKICHITTSKTAHKLESNGGSKTLCENGYYNTAYREVCNCGFQSSPQVILHGRYENYVTSQRLNYGNMGGVKLSDIKQITYQEFRSINYPATPGGQSYTWSDPDGDGYGWVFMGGPILGDSYGTKGTIQTILGSEGDCGRHHAFDELFALTRYISGDATPTLAEFIAYLPAKNTIPTTHLLYGYKEKYQKVSNAQFQQLVAECKGYNAKTSVWGDNTMRIWHSGHYSPGAGIYSDARCYDSSNNHLVSYSDGIKTHCDICGSNYTGNEEYEAPYWYRCNVSYQIKEGQTITCGGHTFLGKGKVTLGTIYDTFTKKNGVVTRTGVTVRTASGFTATVPTGSWVIPKSDKAVIRDYSYNGQVKFTNNKTGSELIERIISCGAMYPLIDDIVPTVYGYGNNVTNNGYWKVTGNGTASNPSTQASVTVTFKDPQQYTNNQLQVRVYDSDRTTLLPQGNGGTYVPLTKVAGTSGDNTLWQGNINILTEIKGSKNIYIQAVDATGNASTLIPMQITYLDSKAPNLTASVNIDQNTWAKTKMVTATATDAFDIVNIGLDKNDMKRIPLENNAHKRIYQMVGDVYDPKTITIYANDGVGNVSTKDVTLNKIDNTRPTITNIAQSLSSNRKTTTITITANDINTQLRKEGSGIVGYQITTTNQEPTGNYQASNQFILDKNGTYYVWVKDRVGNITSQTIQVVNIEIDIDGSITWEDQENRYQSRRENKISIYRKTANSEEELVEELRIPIEQENYHLQTRECNDQGEKYEFIIRHEEIPGYETMMEGRDIFHTLIEPSYTAELEIDTVDGYEDLYLKNTKVKIQGNVKQEENRELVGIHSAVATIEIDPNIALQEDSIRIRYQGIEQPYTIQDNRIVVEIEETKSQDVLEVYMEGVLAGIANYHSEINLQGKLKDYRGFKTDVVLGQVVRQEKEFVVENQLPEAKIQIIKQDSITKETLKDAEFTLYEWNGETYQEVEKIIDENADGIYESKDYRWNAITQGKYQIKETKLPQYHTDLKFQMEYTLNQILPENYTVTPDYQNEEYTIKYEVRKPDGHEEENQIVDNEPWKVKIEIENIDQETKKEIQNQAEFGLYEWNEISGQYEECGTKIERQRDKKYRTNWIYYTKENQGKYRIIQTKAPEGYYGDYEGEEKRNYDINLIDWIQKEGENEGNVIIKNAEKFENKRVKATQNLQIIDRETKGKAQADATLEGAVYGIYAQRPIYHADGMTSNYEENGLLYQKRELVATIQTNEEGKNLWEDLECGIYYIKMIQPPTGYRLDEQEYRIEINYQGEELEHINQDKTIEIQVKKQAIQIQKIKEDASLLEGAGFSIYQISELGIVKQGKIERKTENTYELKDEEAKKDPNLTKKANADGSYQIEVLIDYYYRIRPREEEKIEELPGDEKVYHPYRWEEEKYVMNYEKTPEGEEIRELITDEDGYIESPKLAYGEYIVVETSVPREQQVAEGFAVQIKEHNEVAQKLRIIIDENFRSRLKIYVKDATTDERIKDRKSEYVILDAKTKELQTCISWSPEKGYVKYGTREEPFVVGEDGILVTPMKLEIGEYILEQIKAPEGYSRNWKEEEGEEKEKKQENITFHIKSNTAYYVDEQTGENITVVNQNNEPTKVQIETIDQETREPVTGITLQIQNEEGKTVMEVREVEGQKGKYEIQRLPVGKYKIVETKIPYEKGYVEKQEKELQVEETKEWQKVIMEQELSKIKIEIKDQETKQNLFSKQIQIIDTKNKKVIASTESAGGEIKRIEKGKDGYYIKGLPVGEYEIETVVLDGYKQIETQSLKIEDTKNLQTQQIENRKLKFAMEVNKKIEEIRVNGRKLSKEALKVEVKTKDIKTENIEIQYVIEVVNKGELEGTIGTIIDKIPAGLEYVEKEKGIWEVEGSIAKCKIYEDKKLATGEKQEVRITLRWKNSEINFGEKKNVATLSGSSNEFGYPNQGSNDSKTTEIQATASMLVSLHTGMNEKIIIVTVLLGVMILIGVATVMTRKNLKNLE